MASQDVAVPRSSNEIRDSSDDVKCGNNVPSNSTTSTHIKIIDVANYTCPNLGAAEKPASQIQT
ncbi:hypothetical protein BPAE_0103g00230 [Botrytis paeoniae]|uniref:Uncharacterized protein n=1 Tax=Botrytis paeoniae TaxID=278948 RepID=A0A4Z1FNQ0_9HELO|nr:hypothetical protein BPAE_0103g00230 [Botrytis paeoniae]